MKANQYEAMFLFDPTFGASFEDCESEVKRLMERIDGEIILCRKWDDRRLAYRIKGRKRGVYVLVYFRCAPDRISGLERDVQISEKILRIMVLRADGLTLEQMEHIASLKGADLVPPLGSSRPSDELSSEQDFNDEADERRLHNDDRYVPRGRRTATLVDERD